MSKLMQEGNNYFIRNKKKFSPINLETNYLSSVFSFAYEMTFGKAGEHRKYRSGGTANRRNGEIFCDTFQGKLAEFFVYQSFKKLGIDCPMPDLATWDLGKWDSEDFLINGKLINVKSMAFFSNLLLLETKDWDQQGKYIPNNKSYDFFVTVRVRPELKKEFKLQKILYSDIVPEQRLRSIIEKQDFVADIPGFVKGSFLKQKIKEKQILPKSAMLNGSMKMDAENYYVMSTDFEDFFKIKEYLC